MRSSLLLILVGAASASLGAADGSSASQASTAQQLENVPPLAMDKVTATIENAQGVQNPLIMGAMPSSHVPRTARHRHEKAHLMKRMDRKSGKWTTNHPRYRLLEALWAYTRYSERHMAELDRWRTLYKSVSKKQMKTLEDTIGYKKKLDEIERLILVNAAICKDMVQNAMQFYNIEQKELDNHMTLAEKDGRQADRFATSQTLKHYVRDWADEGLKERNEAFPCILSTLKNIQSQHLEDTKLNVLLPGSGLGRLGHDIANLGGFFVTLNEWSMYMNIGYRYITSQPTSNTLTFHPFIDAMSHHATRTDMLRPISAPNMTPHPDVLLVEGDFTTVLGDKESTFDVIVTHFFIDTARNLMAYFDTIHRLLKPGGQWINFGPLLYGTGPFVQLTLEEMVEVVEAMGFVFEDLGEECGEVTFEGGKVRGKEAEYGFNVRALTRYAYLAQVWRVRKV